MRFAEWEPIYEAVLADFGFDRGADERARDRLAELATPFDLDRLDRIAGERVAIVGGGPGLIEDLSTVRAADAVIITEAAAVTLADHGIDADLMATDLDKDPAVARSFTKRGIPVAIHAHGDNIPLVREHVPACDPVHVLPTTQAAPTGPVRNFGGFTDGDRSAFIADHLGADEITFAGWDFDDPNVSAAKRRKLRWAEHLLRWLERRRGERFGLLDGRRDRIDLAAFGIADPVDTGSG